VGKPSARSRELFFLACYDLDRFRAFVASPQFAQLHDMPAGETRTLLADDEELLQLAYRFLRQVLFGEQSIAMRAPAVEARRERAKERAAALEREAAARMAHSEDPGA
jgi:hypothetical protein